MFDIIKQRCALFWVKESTRACFRLARLGVKVGGAVTLRAIALDEWARIRFAWFISREITPDEWTDAEEATERKVDA